MNLLGHIVAPHDSLSVVFDEQIPPVLRRQFRDRALTPSHVAEHNVHDDHELTVTSSMWVEKENIYL